jgi:hypothetical protein
MRTALKNSSSLFLIVLAVTSLASCRKDSLGVNQPPVADAGKNDTISLNMDATLDGSASYDPDGKIIKYQWEKYAATGDFTMQNPDAAKTKVTGLKAGEYRFTLTVTDNRGANANAIKLVKVNDYLITGNSIIFDLQPGWRFDNVNKLAYLKTPDMPAGYPVSSISRVLLSSTYPILGPWYPIEKDGNSIEKFYYKVENNAVVAYIYYYYDSNFDYTNWLVQYFGDKVMVIF